MVALEIEPLLAEEARKRQADAARQTNTTLGRNVETVREKFPQASGKASEQAAQIVGTNPHYVTDAKSIAKKAPELVEQVKQGSLTARMSVYGT